MSRPPRLSHITQPTLSSATSHVIAARSVGHDCCAPAAVIAVFDIGKGYLRNTQCGATWAGTSLLVPTHLSCLKSACSSSANLSGGPTT